MTTTEAPENLLDKVRKLLAKAEDESCTQPEAEALTAKAAELMAKYGIDRALLAATKPETDKPSNVRIRVDNPWGRVKGNFLGNLAGAMNCQAVMIPQEGWIQIHIFGYESDLERLNILYTSLLLQMARDFARADRPAYNRVPKAWNRSWLLGWTTAARRKVTEAEEAARAHAVAEQPTTAGQSTGLVLADRKTVSMAAMTAEYPETRRTKITYSGGGYRDGYAKGQQADIGQGRVQNRQQALTGGGR